MRCAGCIANSNGVCLAGRSPYTSKKDLFGPGCSFNRTTVKKRLRDRNITIEEVQHEYNKF